MFTLCIHYTIDPGKLADFESYVKSIPPAVERCGGKFVEYYLPTNFAGPTDSAFGFIEFPTLAAYEQYREKLLADRESIESIRKAKEAGCILKEERSFLRPASGLRRAA
jgi:hypothetical protein